MIVRLFRQVGDVFVETAPKLRHLSHDLNLARCRSQQTEEAVHGRRFTRTVLTDKGEEISVPHFQCQPVERPHFAAEKSRPKMHVDIFSENHIAPEQKRLFKALIISSSGLSLKSSEARAFLMFFEVLQEHA